MSTMLNQMVEHSVTDLDAVFHALANQTRRSILTQLRRADATVTELADPHQMSFAAVLPSSRRSYPPQAGHR